MSKTLLEFFTSARNWLKSDTISAKVKGVKPKCPFIQEETKELKKTKEKPAPRVKAKVRKPRNRKSCSKPKVEQMILPAQDIRELKQRLNILTEWHKCTSELPDEGFINILFNQLIAYGDNYSLAVFCFTHDDEDTAEYFYAIWNNDDSDLETLIDCNMPVIKVSQKEACKHQCDGAFINKIVLELTSFKAQLRTAYFRKRILEDADKYNW